MLWVKSVLRVNQNFIVTYTLYICMINQGGGVDIFHFFSPNRHVLLNRAGFMGVLSLKQFIKFHYLAS